MATFGTLYFGATDGGDDYSFPMYDCRISMSRGFNPQTRMIDSSMNAAVIKVTISSMDVKDTSHALQKWYIQNVLWSGKIELSLSTILDDNETRTIEFEDARCLSIQETFNNTVGLLRLMDLTIVAENITIDGVIFSWSERRDIE